MTVFLRITLPQLRVGIVAAFAACFALTMAAFADPAILGRGLKNFVSNFLQDRYLGLGNPPQGAAIGILLLVIVSLGTAVILAWDARAGGDRDETNSSRGHGHRLRADPTAGADRPRRTRVPLGGRGTGVSAEGFHDSLVQRDVRQRGGVDGAGQQPLRRWGERRRSMSSVVCRPPLRCPTSAVTAERFSPLLLSLGLSSPTIVSAFAYFDLYGRIGVRGNLTAVAVAVAVTCFPFMLWTVLAAIEDTDPNVVPAAATMGADPVEQFFFVRLPLLAPGIVTGALVVFVLSITDFVVSQVLTTMDNQTLPVYHVLGAAGSHIACARRGLGVLHRRGCAGVRRCPSPRQGRTIPVPHMTDDGQPSSARDSWAGACRGSGSHRGFGPGVVGSSSERATAAGLAPAYASFDEMLDDDRVDAVHICSPNDLHHEQVMAALTPGKHVVCEKPLALTSAQARELCGTAANSASSTPSASSTASTRSARRRRRACLPGPSDPYGWSPDTTCRTGWPRTPTGIGASTQQLGGSLRVVGDIGSHWLDLVGFVSGQRIDAVMADLTTVIPQRIRPTGSVETFAQSDGTGEAVTVTTEDIAGVLLRFSGGARGVLTLSQVSPGRKNSLSFEVSGADASLAWGLENPEQLWIGYRDGPNQLQLRDAGDYPAGHAQGYADAFKAMFRAVYAAIADRKAHETQDYPTFEDGLEQVLVGEAIAESARVGQWVTVRR